jgi:hypothetical protein
MTKAADWDENRPIEPTRQAMRDVLAANPSLQRNGFSVGREQSAQELAKEREAMLELSALAQFEAARRWLRQWRMMKRPREGSYGLKHMAEPDAGYTMNGVFIAAAIAEGFPVRRQPGGSPNADIAVAVPRSRVGDGSWGISARELARFLRY